MSRGPNALFLLLLAGGLGCGKYGPPVRAGAEKPAERKSRFELPLPGTPSEAPPAPTPEAAPPIEEEPPLEGEP